MGVARGPRAIALVLGCALAASVTGCGAGSDGSASSDGAKTKVTIPEAWSSVPGTTGLSPFDAILRQLSADLRVVDNGAEVIAAACMAEQGFTYEPDILPVDRLADPYPPAHMDPAATAKDGYRSIMGGPEAMVDPSTLSISRYIDTLSETRKAAFDRAYSGTTRHKIEGGIGDYSVPDDGCTAEGRRAIVDDTYFDWIAIESMIENAQAETGASIDDAPPYLQALARWSTCLAKRGFHYKTTNDIMGDALERFGADLVDGTDRVVTQAEIDLATADARCRRSAGIERVLLKLTTAADLRAMGSVEAPILAWMDERDAVLRKAEQVIRRAGG